MEAADFFGIASGNTMRDKFKRSKLTATKSEVEAKNEVYGFHVIGEKVGQAWHTGAPMMKK